MPNSQRHLIQTVVIQTLGTGALAAGALGGVLPVLLRAIGWLGWAAGLAQKFALLADPRINWESVWLIIGLLGAASLLCLHADRLLAAFAAWRLARRRQWTMPGAAAISHIQHRSAFGAALGQARGQARGQAQPDLCLQAFTEAARTGRLPLAAVPVGGATLQALRPRTLRELRPERSGGGGLVLVDARGRLAYRSVMTEPAAVYRLWPRL